MQIVQLATLEDKEAWFSLDRHMPHSIYEQKVRVGECYLIKSQDKCLGILRYNLFWDSIPFLNLIEIDGRYRGQGLGKKLMLFWESEMRKLGHQLVMTSTMAEESAQHFYRKLGYLDCGCLIKNLPPLVESMEIFLMKQL